MPSSKFAAEPNAPFDPFNPQRHFHRLRKTVSAVQVADHLQKPVVVELRLAHHPDFSGIHL
jgi:hypothetical protein